jgi:hypothetical protein
MKIVENIKNWKDPKSSGLLAKAASVASSFYLERLCKKRFILLNLWKNIAESPIIDTPLAVCDGLSMKFVCRFDGFTNFLP